MPLVIAILNSLTASSLVHFRLRTLALRAAGVKINFRSRVFDGVRIKSNRLDIGYRSTVNQGTIIDNSERVTIGDRVGIGVGVRLITSTHEFDDPLVRAGVGHRAPIVIGDGAWLGSSVTVLPGVTIGEGAVIAAGALVTRDCAAHTLYMGVPAKSARDLPASAQENSQA